MEYKMSQQHNFLSSAILKDNAKGKLESNYGKLILVSIVAGLITLGANIIASYIEYLLYIMYFTVKGRNADALTLEQLQRFLAEGNIFQIYREAYLCIEYIIVQITSIFTAVFQIGTCLCYLNIACGRTMKISDIFYGFRHQFGKSLKLSAVLILLSQIYYLPQQILIYLWQSNAEWQYTSTALLVYLTGTLVYAIVSLGISQTVLLLLDFPGYGVSELLKLSMHIMKGHKARLFYIQLSFIPLLILSFFTLFIGNLWLTPYMNMTYVLFFLNLMQAREKSS